MTPTPAINALLCTSDYRGDHSADVFVGVAPLPDETVSAFVERVLTKREDHIELRIVKGQW